jgi:hypothetical protein
MQNYEVGDTVEHLDYKGDVQDIGVVTRIEGVKEHTIVWCSWQYDARQQELSFLDSDLLFRIKTKRPSGEITKEMVEQVLQTMFAYANSNGCQMIGTNAKTAELLITATYTRLQADLKEQQKKNDPEYQKYLELKEKFES